MIKTYYKACETIVEAFRDKYYSYNDGSKADIDYVEHTDGVVEMEDMWFSFSDIKQSLELNLKKKEMEDYYYWCLDYHERDQDRPYNMKNFIAVYRRPNGKKKLQLNT